MTLLRPKGRGPSGDALRALLSADRFRLGADSAHVAHNLGLHGGEVDERAPVFVGSGPAPLGAPSVALGPTRGTLGPFSFGFLDNLRGVAALNAPLPVRPRWGPVALVCGRRDALPDVGRQCAARGLGLSWIVSTGDGEVDEVLAFLAADEGTGAVLLAAPGVRPASFAKLGGKPVVLLGGDPLVRASARRAGGVAVDDFEQWLAHGALLAAGAPRPEHPAAAVVGGGAGLVEQALRAGGLPIEVTPIDDADPEAVTPALAAAEAGHDLLLVFGGEPVALPGPRALFVDVGHLERARALAEAIVARREQEPEAPPALPAERTQARAVVDESGGDLGDHDAKRALKCYGARVSRQGPANSPTAALRVAAAVGLPVDVVSDVVALPGGGARTREPGRQVVRHARTAAEVRRHTAALLEEGAPYVLVREAFPASPRARLAVRGERGVGLCIAVSGRPGDERALLPLGRADAALLARAIAPAGATPEVEPAAPPPARASSPRGPDRRSPDRSRVDRRLVELLLQIGACAHELHLALDLELFVGPEPAVVAAAGHAATDAA